MGNKITDWMSRSIFMTEQERLTALVYGDTFSLYDEKTFDEFVEPLYVRLKANGISSHVFKGKRCLDAGCGGGRGSILMAQCGAREVIGVDLSATNIESCRKRAVQKGFQNLGFQQDSLMELPFVDESFDVVWCNGVLHHLTDPDQGLKEITRVLKTGGHLWLYVYGSGGIYWYTVDCIRAALRGVDLRECIIQLRLMDTPVRRIAEWIDDWFVPYLRRYTGTDTTNRLVELGYEDAEPLRLGVGYDTSQRRVGACPEELAFMGEGDLRFFCRKARAPCGSRYALPDPPGGKGSPYVDGPPVAQFGAPLGRIAVGLARLQSKHGHEIAAYKIIVCRSVHNKVRSLLEAKAPFDAQALQEHLGVVGNLLEEFGVTGSSSVRLADI